MQSEVKKRLFTRRRFFGLGACGVGGLGYMRFGEAEWLEVNRSVARLRASAKSFEGRVGGGHDRAGGSAPPDSSQREEFYQVKILHLSDMHASVVVGLKYLEEAVELGIAQKPDVICLTGDFITTTYGKFAEYGRVLKKLSAAAPAFACMGNHDGGKWIGRWGYPTWSLVGNMLNGAGITVLHNRAERVEVGGKRVQLVGVGDMWAQELDAVKAFREVEPSVPTVLLSHNPDSKSVVESFSWDLMLSGHTHGGQCRLPFLGAPFAPVRDKRYVAGLKEWKGRWIHVTKGVGNLHGVRFNCRPEVSLVRVIV